MTRRIPLVLMAALTLGVSAVALNTPVSAAAPEVAKAAAVPSDDTVVARYNGKELKVSDVKAFLAALPASAGQPPLEQVFPMVRDQMVTGMIISERAAKEGFEQTPEVQARINMIKDNVVRSMYLQRDVDKKLDDAALKGEYNKFLKVFKPENEVSAQHILVDSEAKAKEVIAKLAKNAKFEDLVKEYSKDKGAKADGDLGYFKKGDMVKEFSDAAFAMKKGDVSKAPIKTSFGYHVIKVNDTRQTKAPEFAELKDQIKQAMQSKMVEDTIKSYHEGAKVEVFGLDGKPDAAAMSASDKK